MKVFQFLIVLLFIIITNIHAQQNFYIKGVMVDSNYYRGKEFAKKYYNDYNWFLIFRKIPKPENCIIYITYSSNYIKDSATAIIQKIETLYKPKFQNENFIEGYKERAREKKWGITARRTLFLGLIILLEIASN